MIALSANKGWMQKRLPLLFFFFSFFGLRERINNFSLNLTFYTILQSYQYNIFPVETISPFCFTIFPEFIFSDCPKHLKLFCYECEHTFLRS